MIEPVRGWTIYAHPPEYPDHYVVSAWVVMENAIAHATIGSLHETVEDARASIPPGARYHPRESEDPDIILETWDLVRWRYVEPAGPDRNAADPNAPITIIMTEREILDEYWMWWRDRMLTIAQIRTVEISADRCIEDWVTIHWAERV